MYAVKCDNFDPSVNSVKMFFWDEVPDSKIYDKDTATIAPVSSERTETVNGVSCQIFYYGVDAKGMTDSIYCRACVEIDGTYYYSNLYKYSVVQYCMERVSTGNLTEAQQKMYEKMREYGAAAQELFGHNTTRLATDTYYEVTVVDGTLADGTTSGLYKEGEEIDLADSDCWWGLSQDGKSYSKIESSVTMPGYNFTVKKDNSIAVTSGSQEITDGTVTGDVTVNGGSATIENSTVTGGVDANNGGTVIVSGGTVNGGVDASDEGTVRVTGGTVNGGVEASDGGTVKIVAQSTVNGDVTVDGDGTVNLGKSTLNGNVTINNGTFSSGSDTINGNITVGENIEEVVYLMGSKVSGIMTVGKGSTVQLNGGDYRNTTFDIKDGGTVIVNMGCLFSFDPSQSELQVYSGLEVKIVYKDDGTVDYYSVVEQEEEKKQIEIPGEMDMGSGGGSVLFPEMQG